MNITAAQLKALADLGLTLEQVASAVSILCPRTSPDAIAERREKDRKRKELARARVRADKSDTPDGAKSVVDRKIIIQKEDKKENKITAPKSKSADKRGTRLPEDWQPRPEALSLAFSLGFDRPGYDRHLEQFRDYWRAVPGAKGVKLDWDATWRNRLRNIVEYRKERAASNGKVEKSGGITPEQRAEYNRILYGTEPNGGHH